MYGKNGSSERSSSNEGKYIIFVWHCSDFNIFIFQEITAPIPLKQQNQFALLGSDVDSDDEESNVPTTSNLVSSPPKDWWKDEEEGWQKVQQKEYVVEVERDMTEDEIEAAKKLDEGPTWEDQCDEDAPATETSSAIESPAKEEPVAELLE